MTTSGVNVGGVSVSVSSPSSRDFADTTAKLLGSVGTTTPGIGPDGEPTTFGVAGASSVTVKALASALLYAAWSAWGLSCAAR